MQNMVKTKIWVFIIGFFIGVIVTVGGALFYVHPTNQVIKTWKQSSNFKYDDFGLYYLSVVEDGIDISRFPFNTEREYFIYVGRDTGKPVYGHVIKYSFHPDSSNLYNIPEHIKKSNVSWSAEGVTLEEASGHKVFIPKTMFGGR